MLVVVIESLTNTAEPEPPNGIHTNIPSYAVQSLRQESFEILQMLYEEWSESYNMLGPREYRLTVEDDPNQLREGGLRRSIRAAKSDTPTEMNRISPTAPTRRTETERRTLYLRKPSSERSASRIHRQGESSAMDFYLNRSNVRNYQIVPSGLYTNTCYLVFAVQPAHTVPRYAANSKPRIFSDRTSHLPKSASHSNPPDPNPSPVEHVTRDLEILIPSLPSSKCTRSSRSISTLHTYVR